MLADGYIAEHLWTGDCSPSMPWAEQPGREQLPRPLRRPVEVERRRTRVGPVVLGAPRNPEDARRIRRAAQRVEPKAGRNPRPSALGHGPLHQQADAGRGAAERRPRPGKAALATRGPDLRDALRERATSAHAAGTRRNAQLRSDRCRRHPEYLQSPDEQEGCGRKTSTERGCSPTPTSNTTRASTSSVAPFGTATTAAEGADARRLRNDRGGTAALSLSW